jgi:hypothetical protein
MPQARHPEAYVREAPPPHVSKVAVIAVRPGGFVGMPVQAVRVQRPSSAIAGAQQGAAESTRLIPFELELALLITCPLVSIIDAEVKSLG